MGWTYYTADLPEGSWPTVQQYAELVAAIAERLDAVNMLTVGLAARSERVPCATLQVTAPGVAPPAVYGYAAIPFGPCSTSGVSCKLFRIGGIYADDLYRWVRTCAPHFVAFEGSYSTFPDYAPAIAALRTYYWANWYEQAPYSSAPGADPIEPIRRLFSEVASEMGFASAEDVFGESDAAYDSTTGLPGSLTSSAESTYARSIRHRVIPLARHLNGLRRAVQKMVKMHLISPLGTYTKDRIAARSTPKIVGGTYAGYGYMTRTDSETGTSEDVWVHDHSISPYAYCDDAESASGSTSFALDFSHCSPLTTASLAVQVSSSGPAWDSTTPMEFAWDGVSVSLARALGVNAERKIVVGGAMHGSHSFGASGPYAEGSALLYGCVPAFAYI